MKRLGFLGEGEGKMAAGAEAGRGRSSSSSSSAALEATLDRRFQGVSNTMESIQGLSSWCIENKKQHSLVVRYWMKWLKKSDPSHRLNLFYLANDVIQNCKRKNAIAYRSAFADVLPDAALLVRDAKVRKSVERIFNIWHERSVYPDELITELKAALQKKEQPPPPPSVNPKTALKSKIVAEFAPNALIERLGAFKRSLEESELREKQLAALRVDVCSNEALKRLKDKAGGNKFSKDFEEGSLKLQEFVKFLEGQLQAGPPLLEALGNADVFYEMQYKEVKIVANAYKTFANRVSNLKRKLDALKATLPDLDSPIPSPSEDAPSPTGSESPFHSLGARAGQSTLDREGARAGDHKDNRDVEDMELSEEEEDTTNPGIIVEEKKGKTSPVAASKVPSSTAAKSSHVMASPALALPTKATSEPAANQTPPSSTTPAPTTPVPASPAPLQVNLANVDLGKISSILSSITNVMKNTGVSPVSRPSPGTPTTPSSQTPSSKTPLVAPGGTPASNPLASILSRVDISPEGILSALTKTQTNSPRLQGLSSLLSSARAGSLTSSSPAPSSSTPTSSTITTPTATTTPTTPTTPKTPKPPSNSLKRESERERGMEWEKVKEREREKEKEREKDRRERERQREEVAMPSLESKINSFLQGNPGFSALGLGLDDGVSNSPLLVGGDNADSTPVRDESGSTPTQDEIMDTPCVLSEQKPACSGAVSPTAYRSDPWDAVITPREDERKDRDYRTASTAASSRSQAFSPSNKNAARSSIKSKEQDGMKRKAGVSTGSTSSISSGDLGAKAAKMEGKSVVLRRPSGGSQNGAKEKDEKGKKGGKKEEDAEHYHRIETVVTTTASGSEGTSIEAQGYNNRIQTVESIRVIGRGPRRASGAASRAGGGWYEEEEFMEAPHHSGDHTPEASEELGLVPPPTHLLPPGQYPPLPYTSEDSAHPVHTHSMPHHHPPPFFPTPPPIPQSLPPTVAPPLPQPPPAPSRDFPLSPTSAVMVGGVLVPIDRVLPHPPANLRPEVGGTSSSAHARGKSLPLRPGTLKEQFTLHHAPPLHRPGAPGVPPPLLGRGREGPPSPSSPTTPPSGEARPLLPSPNCLSSSAGPQRVRRPPSPLGPLRPPLHTPHSSPLSQRPLPRGGLPLPLPLPPPSLSREPLLPGVKRPGHAFRGGPLLPPKRPFLPPRY